MSEPGVQSIAELEGQVAAKDALLAAQGTRITELERKVDELTQLVLSLKDSSTKILVTPICRHRVMDRARASE